MNVPAMRAAAAEAEELLGVALELLPQAGQDWLSPAQAEQVHGLVADYTRLAGMAIERFAEAARGA